MKPVPDPRSTDEKAHEISTAAKCHGAAKFLEAAGQTGRNHDLNLEGGGGCDYTISMLRNHHQQSHHVRRQPSHIANPHALSHKVYANQILKPVAESWIERDDELLLEEDGDSGLREKGVNNGPYGRSSAMAWITPM